MARESWSRGRAGGDELAGDGEEGGEGGGGGLDEESLRKGGGGCRGEREPAKRPGLFKPLLSLFITQL